MLILLLTLQDIEGLGSGTNAGTIASLVDDIDKGTVVKIDASASNYVFVFSDQNSNGGSETTGSGIATHTDFAVFIDNFGSDDLIFVDDAFNDSGALNILSYEFFTSGSGADTKELFVGLSESTFEKHTEISTGHGRIETRTCHQLLVDKNWLAKAYQWTGLKSIIKINAQVHDKSTGKDTEETRWFISSLGLNAEQALNAVRNHWQVESMHWVLDMTFREDESRIRKKQGPLVFNVMRKIAMALFKRYETKSASMVRKKKMAGLDDEYRSTLLESGIKMR